MLFVRIDYTHALNWVKCNMWIMRHTNIDSATWMLRLKRVCVCHRVCVRCAIILTVLTNSLKVLRWNSFAYDLFLFELHSRTKQTIPLINENQQFYLLNINRPAKCWVNLCEMRKGRRRSISSTNLTVRMCLGVYFNVLRSESVRALYEWMKMWK